MQMKSQSLQTTKITRQKQNLQLYINTVTSWANENNLRINSDKTTATLFTPHPAKYNDTLNIQVSNKIIPTQKHLKFLGLTFDPKLTYSEHIKIITKKAKRTLNILKALTSTKWGKQQEIIIQTYKAIILSLIHISEPTRQAEISYAVFCLKKKIIYTIERD